MENQNANGCSGALISMIHPPHPRLRRVRPPALSASFALRELCVSRDSVLATLRVLFRVS